MSNKPRLPNQFVVAACLDSIKLGAVDVSLLCNLLKITGANTGSPAVKAKI